MALTRRQATIGGATLLAGTSTGTFAQEQRGRCLRPNGVLGPIANV